MINQQNQFKKISDKNDINKILIEQLNSKNIQNNPIQFNKQQNEIILENKLLLNQNETKFLSYRFHNFNHKYLSFIHPHTFFESENGWDLTSDSFTFVSSIWWEQEAEDTFIFNIYIGGYLYVDYVFAPIYLTVKLLVWNNFFYNSLRVI